MRPHAPGWPSARPTCFRSATSTSSSRCPPRSPTSLFRTKRRCTGCCSRRRPRRFLLHVLPKGFHRVRHYSLLAGATRKACLDHVRHLLGVAPAATTDAPVDPADVRPPCPCCGGIWSSSRPSNAGADHEPRRTAPHRPGPPRHDPAWLGRIPPGSSCASGDDAARAGDATYRAAERFRPGSGQHRCRIQPLEAVLPSAVEHPDDRRARLTPGPNPKTP